MHVLGRDAFYACIDYWMPNCTILILCVHAIEKQMNKQELLLAIIRIASGTGRLERLSK